MEQLEAGSSTQLNFGDRVITSGVGSGGRECRSGLAVGVGVDNAEIRISDFHSN